MKEEKEIDIIELLRSIQKRWKMIVCVILVCTIISAVLSFFVITPKYQVSTKLFIGKEATTTDDQNYNNNDVTMYQKLLKTYAQMIQTNDLVNKAISEEDLNLNSQEVLKELKVTPSNDTQVLEINYIDANKYVAKDLVGSITKEFIKESQELIPNGKVKVIESVKLPEKPVSPNTTKNIAIGLILGLILGIGIAVVLEFTNNTFKSKEELEKVLGVPVIGTIPDEEKIK
ncbi:MAG: Wzz/FepE/Etk N-terminal domain-containing protein [Clostridiaceae bacterium]|nr:Wzz/FepE/Etk N-terminal domain-containing protein [Clostridiaceae bacterium]